MSKNRVLLHAGAAALNVWKPTSETRIGKILDAGHESGSNALMLRTLRFTTLCLPLTLMLAGCGDSGSDGDDEADGTESDGTATETDAGTEVGTDDETTSTTAGDTTEEETSTTNPDTTTEETTGDTTEESTEGTTEESTGDSTTGGGACEPDPGDDECTACLKDSCCDEVTECYADEDCACLADCFNGGGDPFSCGMMCGVMGFPPALQGLGACTMQSCGNECGL